MSLCSVLLNGPLHELQRHSTGPTPSKGRILTMWVRPSARGEA